MGITIVQKSNLNLKRKKTKATKALILAGGAVTGGSFKAGGIKALNDYFTDFDVTDFDIYVGISSGSLLAAPLMGGISPESILRSLGGTSHRFSALKSWHYYRPNILEWVGRPFEFLAKIALSPLEYIGTGHCEIPALSSVLPSGAFDNSSIEKYLRDNIERNGLTNDFKRAYALTKKRLYICAMTLDGARRVIFGPDEKNDVTISEAVQASTAMPGFYKPARIKGVDYVDGGVQETANIDIAIKKGAELIVCYNPFRPYDPGQLKKAKAHGSQDRLAESGGVEILNQIFRALFHHRLHIALDHFRHDPKFKGDIILIEPSADDSDFFKLNPLLLSNRIEASRLGFQSVRNSIEARFDDLKKIFAAYGVTMNRRSVEAEFKKITQPDVTPGELATVLAGKKKRRSRKGAAKQF